jgi:aspartyl-tRNA(Asn)/glutamyl-tRNA(Gln) amidotransferase subunit A
VSKDGLQWLTVAEAGRAIRSRQTTATEIVGELLRWIDRTGDTTNAYVTVTPELALAQAAAADREMDEGIDRGPFHGIAYAVKDLVAVKDVPMRVGSRLTKDFIPSDDATVIQKLTAAGSACLGKVVTHDFAWGVTSPPARNPWDGNSVPGGSSGGSGAAVAAGQAPAAIGTDCACSVRVPSAINGICGMRPTYGRVSGTGVVPVSLGMDTVGPMARSVEDVAMMLSVLAGHDPSDPTSSNAPVPKFEQGLEHPVDGLKLGIPTTYFYDRLETGVRQAVERAISDLEAMGLEVREVDMPHAELAATSFWAICVGETAALHEEWFHTRADDFAPDLRVWAELGNLMLAKDYVRAQQVRALVIQDWARAFEQVDLIVTPATTATAKPPVDHPVYIDVEFPDGHVEDVLFAYGRCMLPVSVAGLPALALPCGFSNDDGMPVGIQIVTPAYDEQTALRVGHAYQQVTDWHKRHPRLPMESGIGAGPAA